MNIANYEVNSTATKDGKAIHKKSSSGSKNIKALNSGDKKSSVNIVRGFKHWSSTRDGGLTVESTAAVNLLCGQSEEQIMAAGEEAGRLAEILATKGINEMTQHIKDFEKGLRRGMNESY